MTTSTSTDLDARELLAGRLVDGVTQAMEIFGVYLGVELGLYRALATSGEATEDELAGAGRHRRAVRPRVARAAGGRRLPGLRQPVGPAGAAPVPAARGPRRGPGRSRQPVPRGTAWRLGRAWPVVPRAFWRPTGRAEGWPTPSTARSSATASPRQPADVPSRARQAWLPAVPDLHQRLGSAPPPRVLDWAAAGGGRRSPWPAPTHGPTVLGVDLDEASVAAARAAAAEAGVADRVRFVVGDAAAPGPEAPFDLVTMFEALHDMGDPVGALRGRQGAARRRRQRPGRRRARRRRLHRPR